jgi:hypothetical protein
MKSNKPTESEIRKEAGITNTPTCQGSVRKKQIKHTANNIG